jgi:DNA invertase Pin-like site-specific DNA recombinase
MKTASAKAVRCAIYTRVSTDQKLEQDFNSLDAQYDASQAYIRSQAHAGWTLLRGKYDDGGFSGGDTDRPALQRLLEDVRTGKINVSRDPPRLAACQRCLGQGAGNKLWAQGFRRPGLILKWT